MAQHLFFMGNKRSGTSLLVRLLNFHPEIFITPESDIVWILYQMRNGWPGQFRCYPWDGPVGMNRTLDAASRIFERARDSSLTQERLGELFHEVQEHLRLSTSQGNGTAAAPKWIGDKKPVQQSDPQLRPFMRSHFPEARYIHIVRNPSAVVASKIKAARTWKAVPDYWHEKPDQILERWAIQEEWVHEARGREAPKMVFLRFENLCSKPVETMAEVFAFLNLQMPAETADKISREVQTNPNQKYDSFQLRPSERARRIMEQYGYAL